MLTADLEGVGELVPAVLGHVRREEVQDAAGMSRAGVPWKLKRWSKCMFC